MKLYSFQSTQQNCIEQPEDSSEDCGKHSFLMLLPGYVALSSFPRNVMLLVLQNVLLRPTNRLRDGTVFEVRVKQCECFGFAQLRTM